MSSPSTSSSRPWRTSISRAPASSPRTSRPPSPTPIVSTSASCLSEKPFVTGTFRVEGFRPMKDMLAAVRGGEDELRRKPLAIFDACPSPPLKWSNLTAQSLIDAARAGLPSELISMGMTGATSPATIAGTLVQHRRREPLRPGHLPAGPEGRAGHLRRLAVELRHAQRDDPDGGDRDDDDRRRLRPDRQVPQAAHPRLHGPERRQGQRPPGRLRDGPGRRPRRPGRGQRHLRAGHARFRELPEPGEARHRRRDLRHGLPAARRASPSGTSRIALDVFEGFTAGMSFLSHPHTRQWYRKEHLGAGLVDRDPYDAWVAAGRTSIVDKAHADVARRSEKYAAPPLDGAVRKELDRIMAAYARSSADAAAGPGPEGASRARASLLSRGPRSRGIRAARPSSPAPSAPSPRIWRRRPRPRG